MSSGIFPHSWDGGIPPNPETPDNPPQAYQGTPYLQPTDTSVLYYGLGCDVRIRAPVLNSIISEIFAVLTYAGVRYSAASVTNLATAIALIAQRGGAGAPEPHGEGLGIVEVRSEQISVRTMQAQINALRKEVAELKIQLTAVKSSRSAA